MTSRNWLRTLRAQLLRHRTAAPHEHRHWFTSWVAVAAILLACAPQPVDRTVRHTRGSMQRADTDELHVEASQDGKPPGFTSTDQAVAASENHSARSSPFAIAAHGAACITPDTSVRLLAPAGAVRARSFLTVCPVRGRPPPRS